MNGSDRWLQTQRSKECKSDNNERIAKQLAKRLTERIQEATDDTTPEDDTDE